MPRHILALAILWTPFSLAASPALGDTRDASLEIYEAPSRHFRNNDYRVEVRKEGREWLEVFPYYAINMNKGPFEGPSLNNQTFAYFASDFTQTIEVRVTKLKGGFEEARIRPSSYGIHHARDEDSISFFLDRPRKLSIEFDQDIYHNLFLFANAAEQDPPQVDDPSVKYFGPGYHEAGPMELRSDETIYLAGGAVVRGSIKGEGVSNAAVRGQGVLLDGGILISDASDVTIEGIIVIDCPKWTLITNQVDDSVIRDVKIINKTISSDGADPSGCRNLTFDDVFFRIPDDCISIKAMKRRYGVTRPNLDIVIKDSVFWSDAAHCILIGPEGNGTSTERVTVQNCDFLECQYVEPNYWGVFGITNGDDMLLKDITFEDCRVEAFSCSNLVAIRIESNVWTSSPGGSIQNIVFKDISFTGSNENANYIRGFDEHRTVDGVTFENLRINGQRVLNAEQGNFDVGPYAENIHFK